MSRSNHHEDTVVNVDIDHNEIDENLGSGGRRDRTAKRHTSLNPTMVVIQSANIMKGGIPQDKSVSEP
ncbi:hypothetical protein EDD11_006822 [Mortierella claussenii]|nr:hypothetical protein EDD11_006822 [Mortierella claussenii]